ncbi:MAG: PDZ domain-containing protein [Myxococcales bacterium]|nr:PDZ domain-containing protein [Myxococcales bacterium]
MLAAAIAACALGCASFGGTPGGIYARLAYAEATGLRVVDVPAGGAAANAGLVPGDQIVAIDGHPVRDMSYTSIVQALRGRAGTTVKLKIAHEGELRDVTVRREPYERR